MFAYYYICKTYETLVFKTINGITTNHSTLADRLASIILYMRLTTFKASFMFNQTVLLLLMPLVLL